MSDEITHQSMFGVDQLATALAKAQAEIVGAEKSRKNDHFKSSYATLADTWEACRGPLTKHGLSIVQLVGATSNGVTVETRLMHASGQSIFSILELPVGQKTAQGIGSAITYGRRYGLAAMVGVAPDDDDDGNAASMQTAPARGEYNREPARPAPAPAVDEPALDAEVVAAVKAVTAHLPEQNAASLRKQAGVPAAPTKLTIAQKQILLKSLKQKLKTLEDAEPDDMPAWAEDEK